MSVGESVTQAKQWCQEARKILNLGIMSKRGRAITRRAEKVAKELKDLESAVTKGKIPMAQPEVTGYVEKFKSISTDLNRAATAGDLVQVDLQANRLSELKAELRVKLASGKDKEKKQGEFDSRLSKDFPTEKLNASKPLTALMQHAQAAVIAAETGAIQRDKIDAAQSKHDGGKHEEARALLLSVPEACAAARQIADKADVYFKARPAADKQLADLKKPLNPQQLAAIDPEITGISTKLSQAAAKAALDTRKYDEASTLINGVAGDCTKARQLAVGFQSYVTARDDAQDKIDKLKAHAQKAAINKEITEFEGKLTEAAKKAAADKRKYDEALPLANEVVSGFAAAKEAADKTVEWRRYEDGLKPRKDALKTIAGKEAITSEVGTIETKLTALDTKIKAFNWTDANTVYWEIDGLINAAEKKAGESAVYNAARNNALLLLAKLEAHPYKAQITTEIETVKTDKIAEAAKEFAKGNYTPAMSLLEGAKLKYDAAKQKADQHGVTTVYTPARNEVDGLLAALNTHAAKAAIAKEIEAITKQLAQAKKLADISAFTEALAIVTEAKKACEAALKVANSQKDFGTAETSAKNLVGNTATAPQPAIEAVQKLLDELKKHTQKEIVKDEIAAIQKKIETAKVKAAPTTT